MKIYSFTNLLSSSEKNEISVNLMRYDINISANELMDYLFVKLMKYEKEEGYKYGSHFYNFDGLRKFKDKFSPEWKPKYIAFTGNPVTIMRNTVSLISGGMKGFFKK